MWTSSVPLKCGLVPHFSTFRQVHFLLRSEGLRNLASLLVTVIVDHHKGVITVASADTIRSVTSLSSVRRWKDHQTITQMTSLSEYQATKHSMGRTTALRDNVCHRGGKPAALSFNVYIQLAQLCVVLCIIADGITPTSDSCITET